MSAVRPDRELKREDLILFRVRRKPERSARRSHWILRVVLLDGAVQERAQRAVAGRAVAAPAGPLLNGRAGTVGRVAGDARRERERVRHRAADELVSHVLEAVHVFADRRLDRFQGRGLERAQVECGIVRDEQRIARRQRRGEHHVDRVVVGGRMARTARAPVAAERLVEEHARACADGERNQAAVHARVLVADSDGIESLDRLSDRCIQRFIRGLVTRARAAEAQKQRNDRRNSLKKRGLPWSSKHTEWVHDDSYPSAEFGRFEGARTPCRAAASAAPDSGGINPGRVEAPSNLRARVANRDESDRRSHLNDRPCSWGTWAPIAKRAIQETDCGTSSHVTVPREAQLLTFNVCRKLLRANTMGLARIATLVSHVTSKTL